MRLPPSQEDERRACQLHFQHCSHPAAQVLPITAPPEACAMLSKLVVYVPRRRLSMAQALADPFFFELRAPGVTLPNGKPLPPVFKFSDAGSPCPMHCGRRSSHCRAAVLGPCC